MAQKPYLTHEVKCIDCTRVLGFSPAPCSVAVFCHACACDATVKTMLE